MHAEVLLLGEGGDELIGEVPVLLHGGDARARLEKLDREVSGARSDLEDAIVGADVRGGDGVEDDGVVDEEVLTEPAARLVIGRVHALLRAQTAGGGRAVAAATALRTTARLL